MHKCLAWLLLGIGTDPTKTGGGGGPGHLLPPLACAQYAGKESGSYLPEFGGGGGKGWIADRRAQETGRGLCQKSEKTSCSGGETPSRFAERVGSVGP